MSNLVPVPLIAYAIRESDLPAVRCQYVPAPRHKVTHFVTAIGNLQAAIAAGKVRVVKPLQRSRNNVK